MGVVETQRLPANCGIFFGAGLRCCLPGQLGSGLAKPSTTRALVGSIFSLGPGWGVVVARRCGSLVST
jgi:hypothetical protein